MEEEMIDIPEDDSHYEPRPAWQVWVARIGLLIFAAFILMYYVNIARGGA